MSEGGLVRLGDLSTKVGSGSTPRGGEAAYKSEGIPLIRSMNVHFDGFRRHGLAFLDDEQARALKNVEVRVGDVLLNITGASIGRVTLAPAAMDGARVNQHVCIIRPDSRLDSSFLRWYLASPSQQRLINGIESGATRQALTKEKILGFEIPLLSLERQRAIIAEIEKQFSRLDEAITNLKRVKANLKRYKAAVLKAAVEGRLVPTEAELARREGRSYETGEQLLQRILETRRNHWKGRGKYREPAQADWVDLPHIPEGWTCATTEQLTTVITDGEHITPQRTEKGVLLLSARNVLDGRLSLENVDFVPQEEYDRIARRLVVQPGDVLLSCSGSVGRSTLAPEGLTFTLVRSVAVLKPILGLGTYISYALRSPLLQGEISEKKTQTAQANIFQGKIKTLRIPLPPMAEQLRIVTEVDRCLSLVDQVETEIDANWRRSSTLKNAVLQRAFLVSG